jgi:hypothetical protein
MKEGLLAPSAEFGSKPVRDHLKRAFTPLRLSDLNLKTYITGLPIETPSSSRCPESQPSLPPGTRERVQGFEASHDARSVRAFQVFLQLARLLGREHRGCEPQTSSIFLRSL